MNDSAAPIRVLMVDDDEDDYFIVRDLLRDYGPRFELAWVKDEAAALESLSTGGFDICLLDYRLGKRTGLQVLRDATSRGAQTPIIFLSGQAGREIDVEAMEAGAVDFLPKDSLDATLLERTIRYAVTQKRLEQSVRRSRDELERRVAERTAALTQANAVLAAQVDERKKIEAALRDSDARKDEFLAILGHELRNPIGVLSSGLQIMERGGDTPELISTMSRQIVQLVRLIDDLLDVSRIGRGKLDLRKSPLVLGDIVDQAVKVVAPLVAQRGHTLRVTLDPPRIQMYADGTRLEQILINLLNNAAKYSDERATLSLTARIDGDDVVIEVTDTGMGMTPEMQARVFDLFVQDRQALGRSRGGMGIGLSLVKQLVELHGGTISVYSEGEKHGSTFTVRLPRGRITPAQEPSTASHEIAPGSLAVLVVDDNQDLAAMLALELREQGHRVRVVHDGRAALAALERELPQVALIDAGLPDMPGAEIGRALRNAVGGDEPLLIAISGFGQPRDRAVSLEAGFDEHLVKPVDFARLKQLIGQWTPGARRVAVALAETGARTRRVLVVDDRRDALLVGEAMLRHQGFDVATADSVSTALAKASEFRPDVILSDLNLSGSFDGYELAKQLRADPVQQAALLVATSGHIGREYEEGSIRAGFDLHVTKPIDYVKLAERLRHFLNAG